MAELATHGRRSAPDPMPLSLGQVRSLGAAAARQLLWGMRAVSGEVRCWRLRASAIPDAALRGDALRSLAHKRASIDGAALFWTLSDDRSTPLLQLLVAYEVMADFLDSVNERSAHMGLTNGLQLHLALCEALDPEAPASDYYRHQPTRSDGGYLEALLAACRERCVRLPSYGRVRPYIRNAASLTQVLGLNHELDRTARDRALEDWAAGRFEQPEELAWFELTAAASAWLTVLALLALAAERECGERQVADAYAAYLPWISLAGTMLDSYVDQVEDAANRDHSYVARYLGAEATVERVGELVHEAAVRARALPDGSRHAVIVACMVAMYLSKDSARTPELRASTRRLACAGGSLARLLLPVLRLWRTLYEQRAT
jgi:tetraprenyl-beta-curcumene synthase